MSFQLRYTDKNGKLRIRQFNSYYEAITTKEKLRKEGITCQYSATGMDLSKAKPPVRFNEKEKQKLKEFLKTCEKLRDLHNKKTYARIKTKRMNGNGQVNRTSNSVGGKTSNRQSTKSSK